jgi:predicted aspartyl protease
MNRTRHGHRFAGVQRGIPATILLHGIYQGVRRMKRNVAFILIDLLVVIAIIAILFPVFAQARAKARQAAALSNAKQNATAVAMFMIRTTTSVI